MDLKDPKKQKIILSIILVVALLYVYFVFDYSPNARDIHARETHLAGLMIHIQNARARIEKSDEEKLRRELRTLEQELARLQELFPLEEEVPALLREVERRGIQSGVHSVLFEPRGDIPSDLYTEYLYRVSVRGRYHNIGLFLSLIGSMDRIVSSAELSVVTQMMRQGASEDSDRQRDIFAEFDMSTYTTTKISKEQRDSTETIEK